MDGRRLVAWNLRWHRVERGLSQEKLAVDAQVDRTYVSSLERGMENPTVSVLERLAEALSIQISDLFRIPSRGERPPKPLSGGRRAKDRKVAKPN
ncbi:helix-turn-helix domain-containing protein [Bradyrhizobium sp. AZCC 1578]|uniref:helix-turn-helix domain-containing protein n=1 Tax=Bradyrhizobium sp. AZCC 1578 TaxID=3117027 RepID=UPI002FF1BC0E